MIATVMTSQLIVMTVVGKAYIAVRTLGGMPAGITFQDWAKSTPVLKKNDLLVVAQRFPDLFQQSIRKMAGHSFLAVLFLYIYDLYFRLQYIAIPAVEVY